MNMLAILLFGNNVEKEYGSLFYAAFNLAVGLISNLIALAAYFLVGFYLPEKYYGGMKYLTMCGVGYSNILFGTMLVYAYIGNPKANIFGFPVPKKILPWLYLGLTSILVPNASFMGHLTGILAAVLIKFAGFSFLLPRYRWISDFDAVYAQVLKVKCVYFEGTEKIGSDFGCFLKKRNQPVSSQQNI